MQIVMIDLLGPCGDALSIVEYLGIGVFFNVAGGDINVLNWMRNKGIATLTLADKIPRLLERRLQECSDPGLKETLLNDEASEQLRSLEKTGNKVIMVRARDPIFKKDLPKTRRDKTIKAVKWAKELLPDAKAMLVFVSEVEDVHPGRRDRPVAGMISLT